MTTATSGRIRRSVRFAQLDAQFEANGREAPLVRERIRLPERLEIPSYENRQDWAGGMGMSPSGRFQVVEGTRPKQKILGKTGIRMDWAKAILWVLSAVLAVVLLVQFSSVGAASLRIGRLQTRIETAESRGRSLKEELTASSGDISVLTRAVEMNLISSGGAPTIQLTAPAAATMNLAVPQGPESTEEPALRASAGIGE